MTAVADQPASTVSSFVCLDFIARDLNVSKRQVERYAGIIPGRTKFGRLTRYAIQPYRQWVADGCPGMSSAGAA
jgi:hypothetical protein